MAIFNVKNYGAKGDGITNDTAAIQAAVNAAHAAGGGQVYIPTGTYIVTGQATASAGGIMLYDNITVYGDGMGSSTVKLQDGWHGDVTGIFRDPYGVSSSNIGMHDLSIDGNRANTTGKIDGWFSGTAPGSTVSDQNITLDHVEIKNCTAYGFDPHERTTNLVITNCISHGNGLDGFTLDAQTGGHIDNNTAYDNDRHGFNIVTSTNGTELTNNVAYGNGSDGLIVQRGSSNVPVPDNVTITGGSFHDNGLTGIEINKADHVTINGADIYGNAQRGIRISGSTGSIIENSTLHDNSQSGAYKYAEISLQIYDDTSGPAGRIYATTGTQILNNTIIDDGGVRTGWSIQENADGTKNTTVAGNLIIGTGNDAPLLPGSGSTYTAFSPGPATTDSHAPTILYAPLLGQSNAEQMRLQAPDGNSGLGHIESGLGQLGYGKVVTMTNMAVGGSTVNGNSSTGLDPKTIWWYPKTGTPGADLLNATAQMQLQIAELSTAAKVTPIVIWAQGEAETADIGKISTEAGRLAAEQQYITSTRAVFDYLKSHVSSDIQFYIVETGKYNLTGAHAAGFSQSQIDNALRGFDYVHDAQVKMALAYGDVHLVANYSDLTMNADMPPGSAGATSSWPTDVYHLTPASKEIAADRITGFIALDAGTTHILTNPGPYPVQALADLTLHAGPGVTVSDSGNNGDAIFAGTTGTGNHFTAGDGHDVFVVGGASDTIANGKGSDTLYFSPAELLQVQSVLVGAASDIHDTVTGFKTGAGGDVVDVSALLKADGYTGTDALADGYIQIIKSAGGTTIAFDPDGKNGNAKAIALALLSGVTAFDVANNLVTQAPAGKALTIAPQAISNPLVAHDDNFLGAFNTPVAGNVLADNGHGKDTGDALAVFAFDGASAGGGHVTMSASGDFSYTPKIGYAGTDSFSYGVHDNHGNAALANVAIAVSAPPLVLHDDNVTAAFNTQLMGSVLADNGHGADTGDGLAVTAFDGMTAGGGHVTINAAGSYAYVPQYGYVGADSFTYNAHDGHGMAGTATVTVAVAPPVGAIVGTDGNDVINGTGRNDVIIGLGGDDTINGGSGDDVIYGGSGHTVLVGNNGNDTLVTGLGIATMTGGGGADTFKFVAVSGVPDTITDFHVSTNDRVDLSAILQGYDPVSSAIANFVHATRQGNDLMLSVDAQGTGHFTALALMQGIHSFDPAAMLADGHLVAVATSS